MLKATTFKIQILYMISYHADIDLQSFSFVKNMWVKTFFVADLKREQCVVAIKLLEDNTMLISCISQLIAASVETIGF